MKRLAILFFLIAHAALAAPSAPASKGIFPVFIMEGGAWLYSELREYPSMRIIESDTFDGRDYNYVPGSPEVPTKSDTWYWWGVYDYAKERWTASGWFYSQITENEGMAFTPEAPPLCDPDTYR